MPVRSICLLTKLDHHVSTTTDHRPCGPVCGLALRKSGSGSHIGHRPGPAGTGLRTEAGQSAHRRHLYHCGGGDLRRHDACLGRHGLAHTDSRATAAPPSGTHHVFCAAMYLLPHRPGGYRACGLYAHAHHLRHSAAQRHPSGAPLWRGIHRLAGGYHLLAYCRGRSGLCHHLGRQRVRHHHSPHPHGHAPSQCHRSAGSQRLLL